MRYDNGPLLAEIEQFLAETGIAPFTFGWGACRNGRLIERLKEGGRVWPDTERKIREFMASKRREHEAA